MTTPPEPPRVGIRQLRNQVAGVIRRARGGERIVVTVDGIPVAQLGPLEPTGRPCLDDLIATGAVLAPRRPDRPPPPPPAPLPVDARVDRVVAEIRGEPDRTGNRRRPDTGPSRADDPPTRRRRLVAVDTSALVRRWAPDPHRRLVLDTLAGADAWCASALARTETLIALHRLAADPVTAGELGDRFRADWDAFHVVPLDDRCCARAAELGARFGLGPVDALHLAAADRLPRPAAWLTLDHRQIPAATALELEVVSPLA